MTRRLAALLVVLALAVSLAGCTEEWRKKFIRKKKDVKKVKIYQMKKYKKEPTEALYNKHYNYLITWLSEMSEDLGKNTKKDARCIEEAIGQMKDLQYLLVEEKARELDKHINRLKEVQDLIVRQSLGHAHMEYARSTVEREQRFIRSEFYYNKIKDYMKSSFEEDQEQLLPKELEPEVAQVRGG